MLEIDTWHGARLGRRDGAIAGPVRSTWRRAQKDTILKSPIEIPIAGFLQEART